MTCPYRHKFLTQIKTPLLIIFGNHEAIKVLTIVTRFIIIIKIEKLIMYLPVYTYFNFINLRAS